MAVIYSLRNPIDRTLAEIRALITAGTVIPSQKYRIATGSSIGVMIVTGLTSNTLEEIAIREDTKARYVYTIGTTGADSGILTTNPTGTNTGDETLTPNGGLARDTDGSLKLKLSPSQFKLSGGSGGDGALTINIDAITDSEIRRPFPSLGVENGINANKIGWKDVTNSEFRQLAGINIDTNIQTQINNADGRIIDIEDKLPSGGIVGEIVGTENTQTLRNKVISGANNTMSNIPVTAIENGSVLSGTNTGDETTSTIKSKLGISTLSGSNTGDETLTSLTTTLGTATSVTELNNTDTVIVNQNGTSKKTTLYDIANFSGIKFNYLVVEGKAGDGVGVCDPKELPTELDYLAGTLIKGHAEYGNYWAKVDNSIVVCFPIHYFKINSDNTVNILPFTYFASEAIAATAGYMVPDCYINGGERQNCVFVDKYDWSLTNYSVGVSGIASSIKNGNPISSKVDTKRDATNPNHAGSFSNCISNSQSPSDTYAGACQAAKSRGSNFWQIDTTVWSMIQNIAMACAWTNPSVSINAWYDSAGIKNFPKGNNNYGSDYNDSSVVYTACDDSYWASRNEARKTGSGSPFAKTTHNGQLCGIADVNGNQWKVLQGVTCVTSAFTITNIVSTDGGTKVEITLSATHGKAVGDWVQLTNTATTMTDKMWQITDVDTATFKVASTATSFSLTTGTAAFAKFYRLKRSFDISTLGSGTTDVAKDMYNLTFLATYCDAFTPNWVNGGVFSQRLGNGTNQVYEFSTERTSQEWKRLGALMPKAGGVSPSGTNMFGQDYFYMYHVNLLALIVGVSWNRTSAAGVGGLTWTDVRSSSSANASSRSCLYCKKRS